MLNSLKIQKYDYNGSIHIHTTNSDGTGTIDEITRAAKKKHLDWIIVTDHNNFGVQEGYINGVCVIKGEEISPENLSNHYLALGINKFIEPNLNPEINIENVNKQNGFGIIAHPCESLNRKNKNNPIRWTNKNVVGDGIEIWNWFSSWADEYNDSNIFKMAYAYLFKKNLISTPNNETLNFWDDINNSNDKITPAIFGVDAHALKIKKYIIPVTIFRYDYLFSTFINKIILFEPLTKNYKKDKELILNAIRNGNNIMVNQMNGILKDKVLFSITNNDTCAICGQNINLDDNTFLNIEIPEIADIKVKLNGKLLTNNYSACYKIKIKETGKYRIEVLKNNKGWIYTNPISVM